MRYELRRTKKNPFLPSQPAAEVHAGNQVLLVAGEPVSFQLEKPLTKKEISALKKDGFEVVATSTLYLVELANDSQGPPMLSMNLTDGRTWTFRRDGDTSIDLELTNRQAQDYRGCNLTVTPVQEPIPEETEET